MALSEEKDSSGDIDMLITHNEINTWDDLNQTNMLDELVSLLKTKGIIVDDLTTKGNTNIWVFVKIQLISVEE